MCFATKSDVFLLLYPTRTIGDKNNFTTNLFKARPSQTYAISTDTEAQLAEAVGTSHGWIQKIESGKKMPGFFLAIKLAVFLEIDMNSFLKDLMEASGTPITASKRQESLVHTHAAKESGDTEVTGHVQV